MGQNAKWDELQLAKDHPFVTADGSTLPQMHKKVAVEANQTYRNFASGHRQGSLYGELATRIEGPFETIVFDAGTSSSYKRLVHMLVVVTDKVLYKLAKPVTTIKTDGSDLRCQGH